MRPEIEAALEAMGRAVWSDQPGVLDPRWDQMMETDRAAILETYSNLAKTFLSALEGKWKLVPVEPTEAMQTNIYRYCEMSDVPIPAGVYGIAIHTAPNPMEQTDD